jgi:hypothetical protein
LRVLPDILNHKERPMCFSAQASFTSGAVISAMGVATVMKNKTPEKRLFAAIPLIFGFQQFAEGVLWLTLRSGGNAWLQNAATHLFLIAALVIWPVMAPLSMWIMEQSRHRKRILMGLTAAGGILALYYAFCLISYHVVPEIQSFHIQYNDDFPMNLVQAAFYVYLLSTITPLFVSSVRRMWLFASLIAVSCVVTGIFYAQYLTSVWCFFAAAMSIAIYWILSASPAEAKVLTSEFQQ